jgi:hypothetical protein
LDVAQNAVLAVLVIFVVYEHVGHCLLKAYLVSDILHQSTGLGNVPGI